MENDNLYAPPEANLEVPLESAGESDLASRWARFGGMLIDAIISIIVVLPVMYFTGYWERAMSGNVPIIESVIYGVAGLFLYLILNGYFLAKNGQTIGKLAVGTKIVSKETNEILPLWKVFLIRYIPMAVSAQIPVIGGLIVIINSLFVYRKDKRCIHDLIAGTKVVRAR